MVKRILIFLFFISHLSLNAQEDKVFKLFKSQAGPMLITATLNDTLLTLRSNSAIITLDYETSEIIVKVESSSFNTEIDSLDELLTQSSSKTFVFMGRAVSVDLKSSAGTPMDFKVEGKIFPGGTSIIGEAHLEEIAKGSLYSNVLSLKFSISTKDLGLDLDDHDLYDIIEIRLLEIILDNQP
jgi:hypothetical protein